MAVEQDDEDGVAVGQEDEGGVAEEHGAAVSSETGSSGPELQTSASSPSSAASAS